MEPSASSKSPFQTKFHVLARGSQALLILFGMGGIAALGAAIHFASVSNWPTFGVCFFSFAALVGLAWRGWKETHADADFHGSIPVEFTSVQTGLSVKADPRLVSDSTRLASLAKGLEMVAERQPLPMPQGTVNADGSPNPGGQAEAARQIGEINAAVTQISRHLQALVQLPRPPVHVIEQTVGAIEVRESEARLNIAASATATATSTASIDGFDKTRS